MQATIEQQAEQRVRRHRSRLLINSPFYGGIGAELELVIDADCDTAWTDGKAIGFNPDFALRLSAENLTAVVAHEILHVAMRHNYRRGARDHDLWNVACDYAINSVLTRDGFVLPDDALLDERFEKQSAEQIYATLADEDEQSEQGQEQGGDSTGDGDSQSGSGDSQGDDQGNQGGDSTSDGDGDESGSQSKSGVGEVRDAGEEAPTEDDWKTKVVSHAKLAKNLAATYGNAVTEAQDVASTDAKKPTVNWRDVLQQFLTRTTRDDYSWSRPSRRHLQTDVHMPSLTSEGAGVLGVAIDVSGSVDEDQLNRFLGELQGIVDQLSPERVIVWTCANKLRTTETFEPGQDIKPTIRSGGGTSFEPVFRALDDTHEEVACLVYFTDGLAPMPKEPPQVPTLWAITSTQESHEYYTRAFRWAEMPTFGETIYLEA